MLPRHRLLNRVLVLLWTFIVVGCASYPPITPSRATLEVLEPVQTITFDPCTPPAGNQFP